MVARLRLAERQLRQRQHLHVVVPEQADVHLAALDQFFDDRGLMVLGMNEFHALGQRIVILDDRCLGDADGRVLEQRLHDEGEP